MREGVGKREKVRERGFTSNCFSGALMFDLQNGKKVYFLCINALRHVFRQKPCVSNLSKGLERVRKGDGKREKVRERRFISNCVSDALVFDLQNSENVDFLCINAIRNDF